jgi:hypothetical protein
VASEHHGLAKVHLEELWQRIVREQHLYQTKDRSMFKELDIVEGVRRDSNYNNPLRF